MSTDALIYKTPTPLTAENPLDNSIEYRAVFTRVGVLTINSKIDVVVQDSTGHLLAQLALCPQCAIAMAKALLICAKKKLKERGTEQRTGGLH